MMCDACQEKSNAWLDYKISRPIQLISIGNSVKAVQANQTARYQEWKETIDFAQAHIREICAKNHGV